MIIATQKFLSNKVTIHIDYGQFEKYVASSDLREKDESGKAIEYNSVVDVLNKMNGKGWEFINAYAMTESGYNVYNFLMRKRL